MDLISEDAGNNCNSTQFENTPFREEHLNNDTKDLQRAVTVAQF